MYEKPLERLNYFNGQRLEASDLKMEQDYHIRSRRWLNKSLYSAGIGRGLEVRAVPRDPATQDPPRVGVSVGLAIDDDGREIILLEEALIEVCSYSGSGESTVVGNYLVIEYAEETLAFEKSAGCAVRETGARTSTSTANFGGPSRVQAKPQFSWIPFPPQPGSKQIALARVELGADCATVHQIDTGIRRYIGAASAGKVRQYALEGERHVDSKNPAKIHFHIRGRQPNSVTLYLRAEKFSTLYYTEMGWHEHAKTLTGNTETGPAKAVDNHTHSAEPEMKTEFEVPAIVRSGPGETDAVSGQHTDKHEVWAHVSDKLDPSEAKFSVADGVLAFFTGGVSLAQKLLDLAASIKGSRTYPPKGGFNADNSLKEVHPWYALRLVTKTDDAPFVNLKEYVNMSVFYGKHQHTVVGKTGYPKDPPPPDDRHKHDLTTSLTIDKAGVDQVDTEYKARSGQAEKALTYVDDLQVFIGLENKTPDILGQLRDAQQGITWDKLGNGTAGHVLAVEGTRAIRLDFLSGVTFSEGKEYVIDLRVASGGGRILYNLYIE